MPREKRSAVVDTFVVKVRTNVIKLVAGKLGVPILIAVGLVILLAMVLGSASSAGLASCGQGGSNASQGANNTEVAYRFLASDPELGLQPFQAAAPVGNFIHESGGDPIVTDMVNSIGAAGIAQWYQGRRIALENHAQSMGLQWTDIRAQLSFLKYELTVTRRSNLDALRRTTNIKDATEVFEATFEVSGVTSSYPKRVAHAISVFDRYANQGTGSSSPSSLVGCVAGSLDGTIKIDSSLGRIVPVPGYPGVSADNRIVLNIVAIAEKYKLHVGDCYALSGHASDGEHPMGLGCDFTPDFTKAGSWELVDQLAAWAEPTQNSPIVLFRWVGYVGDVNHGNPGHCVPLPSGGCSPHIHLSWNHSFPTPFNTRASWVKVMG